MGFKELTVKVKGFIRTRKGKIVVSVMLVLAILALIPVPEVGVPVEEIGFENSRFVELDGFKIHYLSLIHI